MRRTFKISAVAGLFVFFALVSASAALATASVDVQFSANQVNWTSDARYDQAVLKVRTPDGEVHPSVFSQGGAVVFSTLVSGVVQDGLYVWELTLNPIVDERMRAAMRASREAVDAGRNGLESNLQIPEATRLSGHFRVDSGSILRADKSEENRIVSPKDATEVDDQDVPNRDQVILDDLIVNGSACVGQDCANGESFGFDTLRLKENNLRIKFQDTSTSASFPTNDWQLTANDSSNGGQNKFSIDDIDGGRTPFTIEASAPSHSLYVDDGGRIGLGTATPVVEVHVVDGDSPTLRLEQDGSSGFTPQTWDVAGNETNFFVRDATNGSRLPFKIRPGAPNNALYIDTDGEIGLGTTSPSAQLDIVGGLEVNGDLTVTGVIDSIKYQAPGFPTSWDFNQISFLNSLTISPSDYTLGVAPFIFAPSGDLFIAGTVSEGSDVNSKHNIREINTGDILERVAALPIFEWQYKSDSNNAQHLGPMAQDFFATFGLGADDRHISSLDSGGVALAAIQALLSKVEAKEDKIEALQHENEALAERLSELEEVVSNLK